MNSLRFRRRSSALFLLVCLLAFAVGPTGRAETSHPLNEWVKRTPLESTPPSPRLGYEGACVWDSWRGLLVRYGGHNQGGGGEQGAEVWTFDLASSAWALKEPNLSPPGVCCNAQNVFDPAGGRYLRFPNFSGSHGWQWRRELYLNDSSVWSYDLARNLWRNMRPLPTPRLAPLRCASWDADAGVVVVFGGEGGLEGTLTYDPRRNEWRRMRPQVEPAPRSGGQMAYDAARKVHVLFGSQFSDDPHTWIYDLTKNEWRDAAPPVMPPTDRNDAVLTYDPINRVVLAVVQAGKGDDEGDAPRPLETWAYDAGANQWSKLNPIREPDPSGSRARQIVFAPELNLAILENCPSSPREQQIWTYRVGGTAGLPAPGSSPPGREPWSPPLIEDVVVSVESPTRVEVRWTATEDTRIVGYHVERALVEVWSEDQLTRLKGNTPPLEPPSAGAIRRIGRFIRITDAPVDGTTHVDTTVDLADAGGTIDDPIHESRFSAEEIDVSGQPYRYAVFAYRVRSVDADAVESGPSPVSFTIPSPTQWLFSKEEGTTCRLRWEAGPEKGLRGYRIYRMDGRYDHEPVSRLTADPVPYNHFEDPEAGTSTHRYYVVAVDALGQEGFPSSPVWFLREWRDYYRPFVGEWHQ